MGVFEHEKTYDLFRTLGAKRYAFTIGDELTVTVAGVPKEKGSKEMQEKGGIEKFDFDMVFTNSEKLAAVYQDDMDETIMVDGHQMRITRNVTLIPVTYTMAAEPSYAQMMDSLEMILDSYEFSDYNRKW